MLDSGSRPPAGHEEILRLRQFLRWLRILAASFAVLELGTAAALGLDELVVPGASLLAFLGVTHLAWRTAAKNTNDAALLIAYGLLAVASISVVFVRFALPTLLLVPLLAVVSVISFVRGPRLRALLAASFAVEVWVAVISLTSVAPPHLPRWLQVLLSVGSITAAVGLILLLLFQFSSRIHGALDAALAARARESQAQQRLSFLAHASAALTSSLDRAEVLQALARLVVPRLGDNCVVDLLEPDGSLARVAEASADPQDEEVLRALRRYPPTPARPTPALEVLRTRRTVAIASFDASVLQTISPNDEYAGIVRRLGVRSSVSVPLINRSALLGVMTFGMSRSGRSYESEDIALAEELGRRAGLALENARLYNEARESVRLRDEFLSIASHELKTPLTPLQLHLQAMHRLAVKEAETERRVDRVAWGLESALRQVSRLEKLVNSLLDLSRIAGRQMELETESVDLASVVTEVMDRFREEMARAGCELRLQAPNPVKGEWDRLRLEQIVSNLVSNACKFGAGRPVEVAVFRAGDHAVLQVKDQGIGVAPEDQRRIFERFERAVPSRQYGGFGLGLWIVQQIVQAMGGTIHLHSRVGDGTTFEVSLPVAPPARSQDDSAAVH